ncbi:hypothetical protein AB0D86_49930, partial [Streptomyces sp. NPDC048324]|uniref:hypothetical protein n=1 Tax=Streptomyces sp. NPDC048324 TaxID=3157205 RepID=UPI00342438D1
MRGQCRLDLARFDAETTQFDLLVAPAEVFQGTLLVPAGEVAGAVHARAGRTVRVGDETVRRQPRLADVAMGQSVAGDIQLPRHARRHQLQVRIQ